MKVSALILGSTLSRVGLQFLCILAVAWQFDSELAGELTLAIAIAAPIFTVSALGMRNVILTLKETFPVQDYMRVRRFSAALALAVCAILVFWVPSNVGKFLAAIALARVFEGALDVKQAFWIKEQRLKPLFYSVLLYTSTGLVGLLIAQVTHLSAELFVLFALTIPSVVAATLDRLHGKPTSTSSILRIVKAGFPIGVSFAVVSTVSGVPQYFLGLHGHPSMAAVFAIYLYIFVGLEMILNTVLQANYASWSTAHRVGSPIQRPIYAKVFTFGLGCFVPAALLGKWLVPLLFGAEFSVTYIDIAIMSLGAFGICISFAASGVVNVLNRYSFGLYVNVFAVALIALLGFSGLFESTVRSAFWILSCTQLARGLTYSALANWLGARG